MAILIKSYTDDLVPALREFNVRLDAGNAPREFRLPEHAVPQHTPEANGRRIFKECFLALESGSVRGGYLVKYQEFSFFGQMRLLGYYHLSISEGIIHRAYAGVGSQMLMSALRAHPLLFALGMGGTEKPLPRMLRAMGWSMCEVPFYFRVLRPTRFLRHARALRNNRWKRALMDIAAFTGTGFLGLKFLQRLRAKRKPKIAAADVDLVDEFGPWADDLWSQCKDHYAMIGARDCKTLTELYPANSNRFLCLRIRQQGACVGWAVLLDTTMREDKYFGSLRVGSIIDCLALPGSADVVTRTAADVLRKRGVDLIVSNQMHQAWCTALEAAGFLRGPSNFVFAASKALSSFLSPFETLRTQIHANRGDGDGPIHL
jgi:hypothetical protein